jgi:ribosomal protein L37AE/L43A
MAASRVVPLIIQIVVVYLVISWLVRLVRRHGAHAPTREPRGRTAKSGASSSASPARLPPGLPPQGGAVRREELTFNGVLWQVTYRPRRGRTPGAQTPGYETYVAEPPRCPKCGLGVVETRSWLGYTWSCPECGLRQRSSKSMQAVAEALARGLH